MLMTVVITMISMMLIIKLKSSWEMTIIMMNMMNILIMMTYPLVNSIYLLSNNYMLDSMSMIMISLTMWIISIMLLSSYQTKIKKIKQNLFICMLMLLSTILVMAFSMNNLFMFYIWFEASLVPTVLLIIMWGNQLERKKASFYIILYTITASLPMLMMFMMIYHENHSMNLSMLNMLMPHYMNEYILFTMLMLAFMVKLPMFSLHLWLPKAHVEAPLAGSMILAAILLKLGGYGLMRMNKIMMVHSYSMHYLFISIASIGAMISNILCLRQTDLKSLIAYSSIGHMSLLIIGSLSNSKLGQYGSVIIMLTHGLTSSCLFLLSNLTYTKSNSRNMMMTSGLMVTMPMISMMWMLSISMNMALPPSLNIIGEIMIMMTSYFIYKPMVIILMIMGFSTSIYSLYLYATTNHGNQLTLMNSMPQLNSIDLTSILSHIWPLILFSSTPMKLMSWC